MANFEDEVPQFQPYVAQLPVEAMVRTGLQRERQYEEGVQTVQSFYDSLLALPIAKKEVQEYVKQKVGQLNTAVKQSISGDFSDRRLVNQIGGLASQISSDPVVQEGVQSTARIQAGLTKLKTDQERALKEGKNPTFNINDFNDQVNVYLSDGKYNSSFTRDYTPYVDVIDRALKLFKEQNQGQTLDADAFYYDSKGVLQPNPAYYKGVDPSRIQSVLNMVYSQPDVQAQLAVNGRQTFKGMDVPAMAEYVKNTANKNKESIQASIIKLQIDRATNSNLNTKQIDNQIEFFKKQYESLLNESSTNFDLLKNGNTEPLKTKLVREDISSQFVNAYAHKTLEKNPFFDAKMEQDRFRLQTEQFEWTKFKDEFDMKDKDRNYALSVLKERNKAAGDNPIANVTSTAVDQKQGELGENTFIEDYNNTLLAYIDQRRKLAADIAINTPAQEGVPSIPPPYKYNESTKTWVPNIEGIKKYYKDNQLTVAALPKPVDQWTDKEVENLANGLAKNMYASAQASYNSGNMPENLRDVYEQSINTWYSLKDKENIINDINKTYQPNLNSIKEKFGNNDNYFSIYSVQKKLPGWRNELTKLAKMFGNGYTEFAESSIKELIDNAVTPWGASKLQDEMKSRGMNLDDFIKQSKNVKSEDLNFLSAREESFKNQQYALNAKKAEFDVSTPEKRKFALGKAISLADEVEKLGGNATSDAESFLKATQEQTKGEFTSISAYYDTRTGKGRVEGLKGDKRYGFDVGAKRLFEIYPELSVRNDFAEKYGLRIKYANEIGAGKTTNVNGDGSEGYPVYNPKYNIWYHLNGLGDGYMVKYYIKDRATGKMIINGENLFPIPIAEQNIEESIKKELTNQEFIDQRVGLKK